MANNNIPSYNPHFNCSWSMLGTVANGAVFSYLLDKYRIAIKSGSENYFVPFSARDIAYSRCLDIKTVNKALSKLQEMGLISISGTERKRTAHIYLEKYHGAIHAYDSLPYRSEEAQDFVRLLSLGDYKGLEKYGYKKSESPKFDIYNMQSGVDGKFPTKDVDMGNFPHTESANREISHLENNYVGNFPHFNSLKNNVSQVLWEISHLFLTEKSNRREISHILKKDMGNFLHKEECDKIVEAIFDKTPKNLSEIPQELVVFVLFLCGKFPSCMWEKSHLMWEISHTEINNIINIINKEKPQIEDLGQKRKESNENFEEDFSEEEPDETSSFFEKEEKPSEPAKTSRIKNKDNSGFVDVPPEIPPTWDKKTQEQYRQMKIKRNLPFLPAEKVEEYISDIRKCVDRKDKLFLYYLFQIAHELFDTDEVLDEEGNVLSEASTNVIGHPVYEERISQDLLFPAMESVENIMKAGVVEVDGEEYKVTAKDDCNLDNLIDWERQPSSLNQGGWLYIISLDHFRDIYAEEVPEVKNVNGREARRAKMDDNWAFIHKLVLMSQLDDKYELLTDMEKTVYNFIEEFMELDENMRPFDARKRETVTGGELYLTARKDEVFRFKITGLVGKVAWNDFIGMFYENKIDEYENLPIRPNMFDAEKIRRYNALHNSQSHVDEFDLEKLKEECFNP